MAQLEPEFGAAALVPRAGGVDGAFGRVLAAAFAAMLDGSWRRLKANLPTVRVDEITLHPRDNAMIVATHGRVLWILDHLEPIQEYAAAQK